MNSLIRTKMVAACLSVILLSGCAKLGFPGVYKIDVQQGNVITQEMIDQLRPGMTRRQVQFVMGTPLIKDTFDQDRWDYVYSLQPGDGPRQQQNLSIYFENDLLSRFEGDFVPSSAQTE